MTRLVDLSTIPEPEIHNGKLRLGNIDDVHGWVAQVVNRRFRYHVKNDSHADEELIAQGIAIVMEIYRGRAIKDDDGNVVEYVDGWNPELAEDFAQHCYHELPRRLTDWVRRELRQRGIAYRSGHAGGYVQLNRVSYELLIETADANGNGHANGHEPRFHEPKFQ